MKERYKKLFSLQNSFYLEGAPAVIEAGALLQDNKENRILVQLKIKNIQEKPLKAVKVVIQPCDSAYRILGNSVEYQYLDLNVKRDISFGTKNAIVLPDTNSRSFTVSIKEVIWGDNTFWNGESDWEPIPEQIQLTEFLNHDTELLKQYRMELKLAADCSMKPDRVVDLWRCVCGSINHQDEKRCHVCGAVFSEMNSVNMDALKEKCEARLSQEAKEREAAIKKLNEENRIKQEKRDTLIKRVSLITVAVIVVCMSAFFLYKNILVPYRTYSSAIALKKSGDYENAIETFGPLDDYKDSLEQIDECKNLIKYEEALSFINEGDDFTAISIFKELGDFQDSLSIIEERRTYQYDQAVKFLDDQEFNNAAAIFSKLEDYKDSTEKYNESIYQQGLAYIKEKKYLSARNTFLKISSYKDSGEYLEKLIILPTTVTANRISGGKYISEDRVWFVFYDSQFKMKEILHDRKAIPVDKKGRILSDSWNSNKIIYESDGTASLEHVSSITYYNEHGNEIGYLKEGVYHSVELHEDKHNNKLDNRTLKYDSDGNLTTVTKLIPSGNEHAEYRYEYECFYNESGAMIDYDIIWNNLRIVFNEIY